MDNSEKERQIEFLGILPVKCGNAKLTCKQMKISTKQYDLWMKDPEFRREVAKARQNRGVVGKGRLIPE
ncbi:MAG: hypothetical protein GY847_01750 [Proteobacteria bacterium]|nr:hypothetical protein [Pseudomonadota bacterium]